MLKSILWLGISAFACATAPNVHAATVNVSPGGYTTLAGSATLRIDNSGSLLFQATCNVSMLAYLNPSSGAVSITDVQFDYPCGYYTGIPIKVEVNTTPVTGSTTTVSSSSWKSTLTNLQITAFEDSDIGPPIYMPCLNSVPFDITWKTNGTPGASVTSVTTNGQKKFATGYWGDPCYLSLDLSLSPFQKFTTIP